MAGVLDAFLAPLSSCLVVEGDNTSLVPERHFHRLAPHTPRILTSSTLDAAFRDDLRGMSWVFQEKLLGKAAFFQDIHWDSNSPGNPRTRFYRDRLQRIETLYRNVCVRLKVRYRILWLVPLADMTAVRAAILERVVPRYVRFVLWTSAPARPPAPLHVPVDQAFCDKLVLDRDVFLSHTCHVTDRRAGLVVTLKRKAQCGWSGWSRPVSEVAPRLCTRWSRPAPAHAGGTLATTVVAEDPDPDTAALTLKPLLNSMIPASARRAQGVKWSPWPGAMVSAVQRLDHCDVGAVLTLGFLPELEVVPHVLVMGTNLVPPTVLVPAGRGARPLPLAAVTAEFSVELWAGTALALAAVSLALAAAWWCSGRGALAAALQAGALHAVAPLLAQAPPGATAHRPLYAVWLLASVVLAAAYQGLLLSELTRPPADIGSLEQLESSGLDVLVPSGFWNIERNVLTPALRRRVRFVRRQDLGAALHRVVEDQDAALIVYRSQLATVMELQRAARGTPKSALHSFELPYKSMIAFGFASTGSPLAAHIQDSILRVEAAGLFEQPITGSTDVLSPGVSADWIDPLSLDEVLPAFVLLAAGQCAAGVVFLLEVLWHRLQLGH
ncbi:Glutamate receptor ionotropic, delta-2 [Frankliniella fusca]|uniref:Glutamate receptor ionotropic, delta-2 n=1 Tax=Frankliniella fusca TaxID=407009 RepID=A0AAE1LFC9_9NEOP|nr:Glutamate receptor ionotropic, delta-2 [Frankliniella fusca]